MPPSYQNAHASATESPHWVFDHLNWQWRKEQVVYLLHFDAPICPHRPARHYLGFTHNFYERMHLHKTGRGARITQVALERGITWQVARTWLGSRALERSLKLRKNAPRLCPICQQAHLPPAPPDAVPDWYIPF